MEYRGYTYVEDLQEEEDNRKIFHEIQDPNGRYVDWKLIPSAFKQISPYRSATEQEFRDAVDDVIFLEFSLNYCGT